MFLDSRRCWLFGALGGAIGWNYPALESRMRMMRVKDQRELLPLLEAMADAALPIMNRAQD